MDDRTYLSNTVKTSQPAIQKGAREAMLALIAKQAGDHKHSKVDLNKDPEVFERIKDTMLPGESLGAWYDRTGIGRSQIFSMTEKEIRQHIAITATSDDDREPRSTYKPEPRQVPSKFLMVG
jgi:hypothetical protein